MSEPLTMRMVEAMRAQGVTKVTVSVDELAATIVARPSDDLPGLREGLRAVLSDFDRQPTDEYLDEAERIFRAARLEPGA